MGPLSEHTLEEVQVEELVYLAATSYSSKSPGTNPFDPYRNRRDMLGPCRDRRDLLGDSCYPLRFERGERVDTTPTVRGRVI